jgi:ribose-phosphate pyrophosphokinase
MTIDLHAGQVQGFFQIPGDEFSAFPVLTDYLAEKNIQDAVVVSADLVAQRFNCFFNGGHGKASS